MSTGTDDLELLAKSKLFVGLDTAGLAVVAQEAGFVDLDPGELLFEEGDAVDAAYVVLSGRLQITRIGSDGSEVCVDEVVPGGSVGEVGVLAVTDRAAAKRGESARSTRNTRLASFTESAVERLALDCSGVGLMLARRAAGVAFARLKAPTPSYPITLMVGSRQQDVVAQLIRRFDPGRCVVVDEDELFDQAGGIDPRNVVVVGARLVDMASTGNHVIVVGDRNSERLFGSVDQVVAVITPDEMLDRSILTALHARRAAGLEVILAICHPDGGSPSVAEKVALVDPGEHVNLRLSDPGDIGRLLRVIGHQKRALVLGAGGARAFAQIGAIRALEEHGSTFDVVVASGFGAVVGAQYSAGWTPQELLARNRRAWTISALIPTVPSVSLFGGAGPARTLRRHFGDASIEDTWLQFRCCTTDLSTAKPEAPSRGNLADWVRAASAFPGLHPPHVVNGRVYVDGSVVEPLPVDIALGLGATHVTAVDTIPLRSQLVDEDYRHAPEGISWFAQILPVVGAGFPSVFALMERALGAALSDRQAAARARCDVVFEPPVDRFRAVDFHAVEALAEVGYLETARRLEHDGNG